MNLNIFFYLYKLELIAIFVKKIIRCLIFYNFFADFIILFVLKLYPLKVLWLKYSEVYPSFETAIKFGFIELMEDIGKWLVVGLLCGLWRVANDLDDGWL